MPKRRVCSKSNRAERMVQVITIVSGIAAGLCLLALPIWALGVPGIENQYARGWNMGLNILLVYPAAWLLNNALFLIPKIFGNSLLRWQAISASISLVILLIAALLMFQAFKTMEII